MSLRKKRELWKVTNFVGVTLKRTSIMEMVNIKNASVCLAVSMAVWAIACFLKRRAEEEERTRKKYVKEKSNQDDSSEEKPSVPLSVNYHFTRQCNYKCGFCFHTATTSFVLPLDEAKRGLRLLAEAGMQKLNFSGGEPFIHKKGRYIGELTKFCKVELGLASVSIISNGSLVTEKWFQEYGEYLDIMGVSCDSFKPETNELIGRQQGKKDHLQSLTRVREWCTKYKVAFKLNTVVNTFNKDEDMSAEVNALNPVRWKVFQCLLVDGENQGVDALRNAERFVIEDEEFAAFVERHSHVPTLVPEYSYMIKNSYLILDEYMRFLAEGVKPSKSLLDVGVMNAMAGANFDEMMFRKRGGKYEWSKADMKLEW